MIEKIVVVTRQTRLEELIARFNTRDQARFYIEHMGGDFAGYQMEHDDYKRAVDTLLPRLSSLAKLHVIERAFLPTFIFSDGIEADYVGFNSGALARVRVAGRKTALVVG
jgi:hypothetical protein